MKHLLPAFVAVALAVASASAVPPGSMFTYQGRLQQSGTPSDGVFDFRFSVFAVSEGGEPLAEAVLLTGVPVTNGLFTVPLDFGSDAFNGEARWLEIAVRKDADDFVAMAPRQPIHATPYALLAASAAHVPADSISGQIADAQLSTNVALLTGDARFSGTIIASNFTGNGSGLTNLNIEAVGPVGTFVMLPWSLSQAVSCPAWGVPVALTALDADNDGWPDLAVANSGNASLAVLTNNRSGGLVPACVAAVGSNPRSVAQADIDQDGWADLISANRSANTLTVLTNNRSGGFATYTNITTGNSPSIVLATDLNNDGWPDLASANQGASTLTFMTNNRAGRFLLSTSPAIGNNVTALAAADINNDGWPDLIGSPWTSNTLSVLTNNRFGGFAAISFPAAGTNVHSLTVAEVNRDGWLDLVCAHGSSNTLSVLTNNRSGGFVRASSPAIATNTTFVSAAEINSDGWMDLVCVSSVSNTLTVLTNDQNDGFSPALVLATGTGPVAAIPAELNLDGVLDWVCVNSNSQTLSVFFGGRSVAARLNGFYGGPVSGLSDPENPANPAPVASPLRWTGTDFEGFDGIGWLSLTHSIQPLPDMVWIGPGSFVMGSPSNETDRDTDEGPQTMVTLTHGFWIGKHEVRQGDYFFLMQTNPSAFTGDLNRPVERVTWPEATNYCGKLTERERRWGRIPAHYFYRLPTEAEWEYACRADTTNRFSHGYDSGYASLANYAVYSTASPNSVGTRFPNPLGLCDIHGNVHEWCSDWYTNSYSGGSIVNPKGPASGTLRVMRSGDWYGAAQHCRSAARSFYAPAGRTNALGFRVVLSPLAP